jgi:hypothetical protein
VLPVNLAGWRNCVVLTFELGAQEGQARFSTTPLFAIALTQRLSLFQWAVNDQSDADLPQQTAPQIAKTAPIAGQLADLAAARNSEGVEP